VFSPRFSSVSLYLRPVMSQPTFSIITIVYNGATVLEATMQSVLGQTFTDFEYLIIDGASKDATGEIIARYSDRVRSISERDKGIYDAMNKGLALARGEFVLLMNAGDHFYSPDTLQRVYDQIGPETDVVYGDTLLENDDREPVGLRSEATVHRLPNNLDAGSFRFGMNVCHQAFYARRSICEPYNLDYKLSADIDWCITVLKKARKTSRVTGDPVARYLTGGVSKQKHQQGLNERYTILRSHYGLVPTLLAHGWIIVRAILFKISRLGKTSY
jgi:glycosyltransferase involved in cell wall biosynthesis